MWHQDAVSKVLFQSSGITVNMSIEIALHGPSSRPTDLLPNGHPEPSGHAAFFRQSAAACRHSCATPR